MNEPTTYTVKELDRMARLQAKQAAKECGLNSASCIEWSLRITASAGQTVSLLIQYRCMQDPTVLYETSIVI